ncbi:ABC transporter ATP-binding protein [Staphylococcus felis]|uniref:ABC transporter ATP-binding protein n=1 Tax=Staphylococcus felis TaxID=46127 RepID=UPI0021D2A80F|nr:ABC transporter ATP-binding protein [Staphylococcus felis]UXR86413.1 ABC transporter ATP-binding protein [Staphylococcus felis]
MIEVKEVTKTYHYQKVINQVSFKVYRGTCTAIIGPNGSGKTTLIDLLIGDRDASQGEVSDTSNILDKKHLGVMFQHTHFPERVKVKELYDLFAHFYRNAISIERFKEITRFSNEQLNQYATDLSGGQQRILDFALTLIGQPKCLILDEPTSAMDVQMRQHFWKIIQRLKKKRVTILYTSHYIEEVERMANHVLVLNQGKLIFNDTPQNIKKQQETAIIKLPKHLVRLRDCLTNVKVSQPHNQLHIETSDINRTLKELISANVSLKGIEVHQKSLLEIVFDNKGKGEQ